MRQQKGMVLLVTLVMVGLMAVVAVSAIKGSNMQEAMAGNLHDRNTAFQAAEAGLRGVEAYLTNSAGGLTFDDTDGLLLDQNLVGSTFGPVKDWTSEDWEDNDARSLDTGLVNLALAKQPQYVIEKFDLDSVAVAGSGDCVEFPCAVTGDVTTSYFRITVRGFGLSENSEVILQSTYKTNIN